MRRKFVQINGELIEVSLSYKPIARTEVVGEIKPYKSMINGEMITSRAQHREHLKKHNCVEVGNDIPKDLTPKGIPDVSPQRRRELIRAQIDAMSHAEFKQAIRNDVQRIKWNSRSD